jgi:hypothetical protein
MVAANNGGIRFTALQFSNSDGRGLNSREYVNTHDLSPSTVTRVQMKPTGSAS